MATEEFTGEEWRAIPNLPYEVSSLGRVRRSDRTRARQAGAICKGYVTHHGYHLVRLYHAGYDKCRSVHGLVAEAFICARPFGMEVNHKDGDKLNNRVTNLEWVTKSQNRMHAFRTGLAGNGERHGRATMSDTKAMEIVAALRSGEPASSIAKRLLVKRHVVFSIKYGRTWRHLQNSGSGPSPR